jgi:Ca2+-transporting ATPase
MGYKNRLVFIIISATVVITGLILYVPFITKFFDLEMLSFQQLGIASAIGFVSVIWFEAVKAWQRRPGNTHLEDA